MEQQHHNEGQFLLRMEGISKSFPGVQALREANFDVRAGEIHALVGANGAGKSTLMKVLTGAYIAEQGTIRLSGEALQLREPSDAIRAGIHCVYQEVDTALIPHADLTENLFLDQLAGGYGWIDWAGLQKEARRLLDSVGLQAPLSRRAEQLSIAEKQLLLLARALARDTKVLVLDEPTAPLGQDEADRLFAHVRRVRDTGVGCVFISHRLNEVFDLCDRITVMRDGQPVATLRTDQTDAAEIVRLMLGKSHQEETLQAGRTPGETLLEASGLKSGTKVKGVSLNVRRGEVVAVVGLVGAGKTELSRLLAGADPLDAGTIAIRGQSRRFREPADAIAAGIVLVPEERRRQGVLVEESVRANLTLPSLGRLSVGGFLSGAKASTFAESLIQRLGIKPPRQEQKVKFLSGGNQQKVAVGKWLDTGAEVFLFDEPTKGVDIGAKQDMLRLVDELARQGKGVVYLSGEISEALAIADRILIMSYGQIVKELSASDATAEAVLYYASAGGEA